LESVGLNWGLISVLYIPVVFPIVVAVFAIFIRQKYKLSQYVVSAIPFVVASLALILYTKTVYLAYWTGFSTWSLVAGCLSIFIICSYKPGKMLVKLLQILLAFTVFNILIEYTSWAS
jgi:hypothetical protein